MWAVTVIGAPKKAAAQSIESIEKDARGWYDLAQRRYQYRHSDSDYLPARRRGELSGGRDAAVRFGARDGGARDAPEGHRLLPHPGRGAKRGAGGGAGAPADRRRREAAPGG